MTTVAMTSEQLVCAGFYLGHPATGPDPRRDAGLIPLLAELGGALRFSPPGLFHDLDGARAAARQAAGALAPQGLWVPIPGLVRLRREVADTALAAVLDQRLPVCTDAVVAAGNDVVGFGGDMVLTFAREPAGLLACRRHGLPSDPPPFVPDAAMARRLAAALNDDDLGAPVLWVRCWRTVHATLD